MTKPIVPEDRKVKLLPIRPLLVSVKDAAGVLQISEFKCRELIHQGVIPSIPLGERSTRIRITDLEKLVESGFEPDDVTNPGPLRRVK